MIEQKVAAILVALNEQKSRATYSAVGELIGVHPKNVDDFLGERRPYASWVVSRRIHMPSYYLPAQRHPELESKQHVIDSGAELATLLN